MAGNEVAVAYVSLAISSGNDFAKDIKSQFGQVTTAADSMSNGISTKTAAIAGAVGGLVSAAATSLVGFIGSFVSEAVEASDATDKFKQTLDFAGLDTSTIEKLTASTQDYADKTVYSLSDIQNVTAQLAANSVDDYDKLAEAAGNLNAVAGGNAETFSSVGMVLTQTAGAGKLTTENWNQLADAIPGASGKLQEAMKQNGAYTGNFRDAMEKGEITAGEFNEAIMQLGMTDVAADAATSTSTIEGAWGNLQATLVGGLSELVTEWKPAITDTLGAASSFISGTVMPAVETLSGWITGTAVPALQSFGSWVSQNKDWLSALAVGVGSVVVAYKAWQVALTIWGTATKAATAIQLAFNVVMNANPIMLVVTAIGALAAGLVYFFTQTETGRELWSSFTSWLSSTAQALADWWNGLWASVGAWWSSVWQSIATAATTIWTSISSTASSIWDGVVSFFAGIPDRIRSGLSALGNLWSTVGRWFGDMRDAAKEKFEDLVSWVKDVPNKIKNALGNVSSLLWDAGSQIISGLWEGLKSKWESVESWVSGIGDWIADHKGPKAYDLKLLVPNGQWIMGGLAEGLESSFHDKVLGTVGSMGPRLADELQTAASSNLSSSISAASSSAASVVSASVSSSDVEAMAERIAERTANALYQAMTGSSRTLSLQSKAGVVI